MNKILFRLGLLAFCISVVIFGFQNLSLMDTITRAFIVFVSTILIGVLGLLAVSALGGKDNLAGNNHEAGNFPHKQDNFTSKKI